MINKIFQYLLVLLISVSSYAQNSKIQGKIIEKDSYNPIEFVSIKNLNNNEIATSNSNGEFSIGGNIDDKIEVSHMSYKTIITKLQSNLNIELEPIQIELNEILVNANPLLDISQSVVINDTEKRISQPRSVGHLFRDIKGFGITKKGAYASEPVFRAFKYEQLNDQYNGGMTVLNACPNRMDTKTTHVIYEENEKIQLI